MLICYQTTHRFSRIVITFNSTVGLSRFFHPFIRYGTQITTSEQNDQPPTELFQSSQTSSYSKICDLEKSGINN